MKTCLLLIFITTLFACSKKYAVMKVGQLVPSYTFNEILNTDQQPFNLENVNKPIIIEFWATWCSPCLPAMSKLEELQERFSDEIEIITVSTDNKKNLSKYIENTNTSLRIAFDSTHNKIFHYQYIPQTVLIDKKGIVKAITTPDKITEDIVKDLIDGKHINIKETQTGMADNLDLEKEYKGTEYQYTITAENLNLNFDFFCQYLDLISIW